MKFPTLFSKHPFLFLVFTFLLLIANSCKKESNNDKLPPATQTGENTFGCLINGKVYIPKGYDGSGRPNPQIHFDYDLQGEPFLSIRSSHYKNKIYKAGVNIGFNLLDSIGYFEIGSKFSIDFGWEEVINNCGNASWDSNIYRRGGGYITKLDGTNRIISGTFACVFKNLQCDTVRITDGRFDIKF